MPRIQTSVPPMARSRSTRNTRGASALRCAALAAFGVAVARVGAPQRGGDAAGAQQQQVCPICCELKADVEQLQESLAEANAKLRGALQTDLDREMQARRELDDLQQQLKS